MLTMPRLTGVLRVVLQNEINSAKDAESEMKLSNKNGEIIKIDNSDSREICATPKMTLLKNGVLNYQHRIKI